MGLQETFAANMCYTTSQGLVDPCGIHAVKYCLVGHSAEHYIVCWSRDILSRVESTCDCLLRGHCAICGGVIKLTTFGKNVWSAKGDKTP